MIKNVIYLKEASSYDDILKNKHNKMPYFLKKIIFLYKNIFNVITKKNIDGNNIWILPMKEKYLNNKIKKIFKYKLDTSNSYVLSNELNNNRIHTILQEYKIEYVTEEKVKKLLLLNILEYITTIQKRQIRDLEVTILANNSKEINLYLIEEMGKIVKSLKIVSLNIYKFKKIEEKLYNQYGIAIQFSNSYKKSLEKSRVIINLDFDEIEINEYEIYNKGIIINCIADNIKLRSKLFEGIIINSCDIEFKKELITKFKYIGIYKNFKELLIYASLIENENDFIKLKEKIKLDNIIIRSLIGNNGIINKKEFKNIKNEKLLDKNRKTE